MRQDYCCCSENIPWKACRLSFVSPCSSAWNYLISTGSRKPFCCSWRKKKGASIHKQYTRPILRATLLQNSCISLLGVSTVVKLYSAVGSSFSLILFSEIGDKTFFLAALLAMKYRKRIVFVATLTALLVMTILSVLIGQLFHAFPSSLHTLPIDDYIATALLFWFGVDNIRAYLKETPSQVNQSQDDFYSKEYASSSESQYGAFGNIALGQILQVFSIIFTAEWGDKSMLATVALSATQPPLAVMLGKPKNSKNALLLKIVTTHPRSSNGSSIGNYISSIGRFRN